MPLPIATIVFLPVCDELRTGTHTVDLSGRDPRINELSALAAFLGRRGTG